MRVTFDPVKNARNHAKHGLWFEEVCDLDWQQALYTLDDRKAYGEVRFVA
jgi:uncharacterized protein